MHTHNDHKSTEANNRYHGLRSQQYLESWLQVQEATQVSTWFTSANYRRGNIMMMMMIVIQNDIVMIVGGC
jgi:hypothetical protein